jgi:hypothetical protein
MSDAFAPDLGVLQPETLPVARGQPGYQPPGGPQRQARNEAYIPSMRNRPYSQWGDPDFAMQGAQNYPGMSPGPFMPQISDLPGLIHGAVMGLGRYGSRHVGMPAIAMGTYATAFLNAYNKGLKERAAQNWQQYQQARQMTIDRQTDEIAAYKDVYNAYHDEKGNITDPTAFNQAILAVADKYQDDPIRNAIRSGNSGMVDRILQGRDGHLNDLKKTTMQEERQKREEERQKAADESRKLEDEERQQRIEAGKRKAREDEQWGTPPATTRAVPGTPATPSQPSPPQPTTTPSEGDVATPDKPAKSYALPPANPNVDYAARQRLLNRPTKVPADHESDVDSRAAAYRDAFDQIDNDPSLNTREKLIGAVKSVFPEMGQLLQGYLDGRMTDQQAGRYPLITDLAAKVGGKLSDKDEDEAQRMADYLIAPYSQAQRNAVGQRGVRARAVMDRADEIVKARGGQGYDQKRYTAEQRAQITFDTGRPAEQIDALNTAINHLATIDAYADALDSGLPQTIQAAANRFITEFGGSAPTTFEAARDIVANEVVNAITRTGGTLTDRQEARERIFAAQSANVVKDVTSTYRHLLGGRLDPLMKRWEQTTGRSRDEFLQRLTPEARNALVGRMPEDIPKPKASIWDFPNWTHIPTWAIPPGGTLGGQIFPPSSITPTKPGTLEPQDGR